jgi:hypothetical protein
LLQEIENEITRSAAPHEDIEPKIRFPRGFIGTAETYRRSYPCRVRAIANNVAYTLQFHDVLRWLLRTTDLDITAKEMVIKYGIVSVVSVVEGLAHDALLSRGVKNSPKTLKKTIEQLVTQGRITADLANALQTVRKKREKIHLHLYKGSGKETYEINDWNFAVGVLQRFATELRRSRST